MRPARSTDAGANVTDLTRFLTPGVHLTPHSDLVALMVLEHQARIVNLMTRVAWETRLALADHAALKLPNEPAGEWSASIRGGYTGPPKCSCDRSSCSTSISSRRRSRAHPASPKNIRHAARATGRGARCTSSSSSRSAVSVSLQSAHLFRTVRRSSTGGERLHIPAAAGRADGPGSWDRLRNGQRRRACRDSRHPSRHAARSAAAPLIVFQPWTSL